MIEIAHAILLLEGRYVLQLRDDRPDISCPGQWSLFGGKMEEGETPAQAVRREIDEELSLDLKNYRELWAVERVDEFHGPARLWFFSAAVDGVWPRHELHEGREARAFAYEELAALSIPGVVRETLARFEQERVKC